MLRDTRYFNQYILIRYKDMTLDILTTTMELENFLNNSINAGDVDFKRHERNESSIRNMNEESLKNLTNEEIGIINEIAGTTLLSYGYDLISQWKYSFKSAPKSAI